MGSVAVFSVRRPDKSPMANPIVYRAGAVVIFIKARTRRFRAPGTLDRHQDIGEAASQSLLRGEAEDFRILQKGPG